jgi:hypothetical protein
VHKEEESAQIILFVNDLLVVPCDPEMREETYLNRASYQLGTI